METLADWVTVLGFPAALFGLYFVYLQRKADGLTASASAINSVYNNINARILSMGNSLSDNERKAIFLDLLNDLEMACALYLDGQFQGRTGHLSSSLIRDILETIGKDDELTKWMDAAIHADHTFINITDFLAVERKKKRVR